MYCSIWRRWVRSAQIVLLFTFLLSFAFSFYTHNISTDHLRQRNTFGHWTPLTCFRTLYPRIQHGHLKFFGTMATCITPGARSSVENSLGSATDWGKGLTSPPLPSILLTNVQSLENKIDDLRARISFQRDIRDCKILCLTETWLTPSVLDTAITPYDNFSVLRMDRTAEAGKTKSGGVCFMINKKCCDPRNISILLTSSGKSIPGFLKYFPGGPICCRV